MDDFTVTGSSPTQVLGFCSSLCNLFRCLCFRPFVLFRKYFAGTSIHGNFYDRLLARNLDVEAIDQAPTLGFKLATFN